MFRCRMSVSWGALLFLAGCYFKAPVDLIGSHASALARSDSLLVIGGEVYRIDDMGSGYFNACHIVWKNDRAGQCANEVPIKFERTGRGNVLVQMADESFALVQWTSGAERGCLYFLGEGLSIDSPLEPKALWKLEAKILKGLPAEVNSRQELARIVDLYETRILTRYRNCPAHQILFSDPAAFQVESPAPGAIAPVPRQMP